MLVPLIYEAAGLAKNRAALAISSTLPNLYRGIALSNLWKAPPYLLYDVSVAFD